MDRSTKLRLRRLIRRRKRQVEDIGDITEEGFDRHIFRRLIRLPQIRRFLAGWIGLVALLILGVILQTRALDSHYKVLAPHPGGTFTEGIIGSFNNASPLYASGSADSSISRLIFSGLLKYDERSKLVNELAESWTLDASETLYTVELKKNLVWHDGHPFTAKDVVFTFNLIQNAEAKSFLFSSWRGIKVEAKGDHTVIFTLPGTLSAFPHSLTTGIVPEHILASVPPGQLRSHSFNNVAPIGTGPFRFDAIEVTGDTAEERTESVGMAAFDRYHAGKPKLDRFIIHTFKDEKSLIANYSEKRIDAMVGLTSLPDEFKDATETIEFSVPLTGEVFVFFKTTQDILKEPQIRKALILGVDKQKVLSEISYPLSPIDSPLLTSSFAYSKSFAQATNQVEEANKILDAAGWVRDPSTGMRSKNGVKLGFRMLSETTSEYSSVSGSLQKQWHDLGVDVQVELQPDEELQTNISLHNYDALLYGISIGPDPDVFAYWHGSQADPRSDTRLNFSEYKSVVVDQALEGGRTRSDQSLRAVKYKPFLETWRNDNPALALYQPRLLYIVRSPLYGFDVASATSAADRFAGVDRWMVRDTHTTRQ